MPAKGWQKDSRGRYRLVDVPTSEELELFKASAQNKILELEEGFDEMSQLIDNLLEFYGESDVPTPPQTLRWPPQLIPLTWSVDWDGAPTNLTRGQMLTAMRRVFAEYTRAGLRFRYVTGAATLEIGFQRVDGPGGTLAFVYQPASGTNMAACGGACGDYFFDNEETLTAIDFENIFRHETGHAIGMDHTNSGVMAPTYAFGSPRTILDELVTDYIEINYPVTQA